MVAQSKPIRAHVLEAVIFPAIRFFAGTFGYTVIERRPVMDRIYMTFNPCPDCVLSPGITLIAPGEPQRLEELHDRDMVS